MLHEKKIGFFSILSEASENVYLFVSVVGFLWSLYLYTVFL